MRESYSVHPLNLSEEATIFCVKTFCRKFLTLLCTLCFASNNLSIKSSTLLYFNKGACKHKFLMRRSKCTGIKASYSVDAGAGIEVTVLVGVCVSVCVGVGVGVNVMTGVSVIVGNNHTRG